MTEVLKALSDPTRRQILLALREKDMTAGEIGTHSSLTAATMSHHLSVLREADLIRVRRNGTQLIYSISTSVIEDLITNLIGMIPPKIDEK